MGEKSWCYDIDSWLRTQYAPVGHCGLPPCAIHPKQRYSNSFLYFPKPFVLAGAICRNFPHTYTPKTACRFDIPQQKPSPSSLPPSTLRHLSRASLGNTIPTFRPAAPYTSTCMAHIVISHTLCYIKALSLGLVIRRASYEF